MHCHDSFLKFFLNIILDTIQKIENSIVALQIQDLAIQDNGLLNIESPRFGLPNIENSRFGNFRFGLLSTEKFKIWKFSFWPPKY